MDQPGSARIRGQARAILAARHKRTNPVRGVPFQPTPDVLRLRASIDSRHHCGLLRLINGAFFTFLQPSMPRRSEPAVMALAPPSMCLRFTSLCPCLAFPTPSPQPQIAKTLHHGKVLAIQAKNDHEAGSSRGLRRDDTSQSTLLGGCTRGGGLCPGHTSTCS
jgi:hypothetical protein